MEPQIKRAKYPCSFKLLRKVEIQCVLEFLSYAERVALLQAYPVCFVNTMLSARNLISSKLCSLGFDGVTICNTLVKTKTMITGSFLLWCITADVNWKPKHLDVLSTDSEPGFANYLKETYGTRPLFFRTTKRSTASTQFVYDMFLPRINLETSLNAGTHIANIYDFDFCKIVFDGTRLLVANWDAIWKRETTMDHNVFFASRQIPQNPKAYLLHTAYLMKMLYARQKKYQIRGFNVVFINEK